MACNENVSQVFFYQTEIRNKKNLTFAEKKNKIVNQYYK